MSLFRYKSTDSFFQTTLIWSMTLLKSISYINSGSVNNFPATIMHTITHLKYWTNWRKFHTSRLNIRNTDGASTDRSLQSIQILVKPLILGNKYLPIFWNCSSCHTLPDKSIVCSSSCNETYSSERSSWLSFVLPFSEVTVSMSEPWSWRVFSERYNYWSFHQYSRRVQRKQNINNKNKREE